MFYLPASRLLISLYANQLISVCVSLALVRKRFEQISHYSEHSVFENPLSLLFTGNEKAGHDLFQPRRKHGFTHRADSSNPPSGDALLPLSLPLPSPLQNVKLMTCRRMAPRKEAVEKSHLSISKPGPSSAYDTATAQLQTPPHEFKP